MTELHWSIVMRNNGILCGWHPEEEVPKEFMLPNRKTFTIPSVTEVTPGRKAYYPGMLEHPTVCSGDLG